MADNKFREIEKVYLTNKSPEAAVTLAKEMLRTGQGNLKSHFVIKKKDKNEYYYRSRTDYKAMPNNYDYRYVITHQFATFEKAKTFTKTQVYNLVTTQGIPKGQKSNYEVSKDLEDCEVLEIYQISLVGNALSADEIIYDHKLKNAQKEKSAAEKKLKKLAEEESKLLKEIEEKNKLLKQEIDEKDKFIKEFKKD